MKNGVSFSRHAFRRRLVNIGLQASRSITASCVALELGNRYTTYILVYIRILRVAAMTRS